MLKKEMVWVGMLVLAVSAHLTAAPITVPNGSFEAPVLADGQYGGNVAIPPWNSVTVWREVTNPSGSDVAPFPSGMVGASGNGTPQGGDGTNVLYMHQGANGSEGRIFVSTDGVTALGTYTLTVAVGTLSNKQSHGFTIAIYDTDSGYSGGAKHTGLGSELTPGTLVDKSVTWTVTDPDMVGRGILVSLGISANPSAVTGCTLFDNVRVDFTPVPEPGTMALVAMGSTAWVLKKKRL